MKRWNTLDSKERECPEIDAFLTDIVELCEKHKLSLSHDDPHCMFCVGALNAEDNELLMLAHDGIKRK